MAKKGGKGGISRNKVVGRKYVYFWNPKAGCWMKAKRLKDGRLEIVGKATPSEVKKAMH